MPIRPEMRGFYPSDWSQISRRVRFERAGGVCQGCGRPHGLRVRCLPDGRWFDTACQTWRNGRGRPARWPDLVETALIAAVLAVAAIFSLRSRAIWALLLIWLFNLWGTADLLNAYYQGAFGAQIGPGSLGAAFFIPTVLVPPLLIIHGLIFRLLLRPPAL